MTDEERQRMKCWVETWKRAGPLLEAFRYQELFAHRHDWSAEALEGLLEMGYRNARPRHTSGLAEQQRLFGKLRR